MPKRTFKEEASGPQSTNRFVVPTEIPVKQLSGSITQPAAVQPKLSRDDEFSGDSQGLAPGAAPGEASSLGSFIVSALGVASPLGVAASIAAETGAFGEDIQRGSREMRGKAVAAIDRGLEGLSLQDSKNNQAATTIANRAAAQAQDLESFGGYGEPSNTGAGGMGDAESEASE
jgi:hypothetical protein